MSKGLKTVLIVVAVLLGLCTLCGIIGGVFLWRAGGDIVSLDATKVEEKTQEIVSYDLPIGYTPQMGMSLLGMNLGVIEGADSNDILMMIEMPTGTEADKEEMEEQLKSQFSAQFNADDVDFELVDEMEILINGASSTLETFEGSDSDGEEIRMMSTVIESNDGDPAYIMLVGDMDTWDVSMSERFWASMQDGR